MKHPLALFFARPINFGLIILFGLSLWLATLGTCTAQTLLYAQQTSGNIYTINPTTGTSTLIFSEPAGTHYWNGATYDPLNQQLYISDVGTSNELGGMGNTIYDYNLATSTLTEVGVSSSSLTSFYDAGFHSGQYYTIPVDSNQLLSYTLPASGTSLLTPTMTATLGGLGTNVTGLILGDIDFVGNSVFIYGTQVINGNSAGNNVLYKYTDVSNLTAPAFAVVETGTGAGLVYDSILGKLIITNTDGTFYYVDPGTGAETAEGTITGVSGNGDFAFVTPVPEPSSTGLVMLVIAVMALVARRFKNGRSVPTGHEFAFCKSTSS